MNAGPTVNLAEAARHSPRSVATLRRWLAAGTIAGAERDAVTGAWLIPIASLVEAGAWPTSTPPEPHYDPDPTLQANADLEAALEDALAQIEAITAVARASEEQARHQIELRELAERNADDLRTALRMLEAGPRPTPEKRPNIFQRLRERGEAAVRDT